MHTNKSHANSFRGEL